MTHAGSEQEATNKPNPAHPADSGATAQPSMKRRCLILASIDPAQIAHARQQVCAMPGVLSVTAEKGCFIVEYNLLQSSLVQIEEVASAAGLSFKGGWHAMRRRVWKYTEVNELDNAASKTTGACCNRPPARLR